MSKFLSVIRKVSCQQFSCCTLTSLRLNSTYGQDHRFVFMSSNSFAPRRYYSMKGNKYIYAHKFEGMPKVTDLQLVEEEIPAIKDGEVLVQVQSLSVDPYMRAYTPLLCKEGDDMINYYVAGKVIDSKEKTLPIGTNVCGAMGCRTHAVMSGRTLTNLDFLDDLPISYGTGAAGLAGLTAYFGVLNILTPKKRETLYVNSAAGAVGAVVGQIAKIKGCRVVGSAGSDEKVAYCKSLGFDEVFNYKTVTSIKDALKATCPDGIDMFFENVGGPAFSEVIFQMNTNGRAAVCGAIATYNQKKPEMIEDILWPLVRNRIKIQGFNVMQFTRDYPDARRQLVQWIKEGKIIVKEHITYGFENFPKAFVDLFTGDNFGKAVVNVGDSSKL